MTEITTRRPTLERQLRVVRILVGAALAGVLVAATAGLVLLATEPTSGSSTAAALGIIAATAGIATAVCAVGVAIYAQVRNLWQYFPTWVRVAAWALIALSVITSWWSSSAV